MNTEIKEKYIINVFLFARSGYANILFNSKLKTKFFHFNKLDFLVAMNNVWRLNGSRIVGNDNWLQIARDRIDRSVYSLRTGHHIRSRT